VWQKVTAPCRRTKDTVSHLVAVHFQPTCRHGVGSAGQRQDDLAFGIERQAHQIFDGSEVA